MDHIKRQPVVKNTTYYYISIGIIIGCFMDWILKYVEANFGEIYALLLAGIFILYVLVFLVRPVYTFFSGKKPLLGIWKRRKAIRHFPAMCKMYGFKKAWGNIFIGERKPYLHTWMKEGE